MTARRGCFIDVLWEHWTAGRRDVVAEALARNSYYAMWFARELDALDRLDLEHRVEAVEGRRTHPVPLTDIIERLAAAGSAG